MERAEIKHIGDYLKDLEEGFIEWDFRRLFTHSDLNRLHVLINCLTDATFATDDQEIKPLLAPLEYKARPCKECVEARLAVKN